VIVAGALLLSPIQLALVALFGSFDPHDHGGDATIDRAVFNQCNVSICAFTASALTHLLSRAPAQSLAVIPLAIVGLLADLVPNYVLIGLAISSANREPFGHALRRLSVGGLADQLLMLGGSAALGIMLGVTYGEIGGAALAVFVLPVFLSQRMLSRSQLAIDTERTYRSREAAISQLTERIHEERTDERRLIAADLHDEVLQPLFKVSLMAHVLKADLSNGKLLELDDDLPELLSAAEVAAGSLRELIGDLRKSSLGGGGLPAAISALVRRVADGTTMRLHAKVIAPPATDPVVGLALYHIAKEALTNSASHSRAKNCWLSLDRDEGWLMLALSDDGEGFDPSLERLGHYGISIMRERANLIGGTFELNAAPGQGCRIKVRVPLAVAEDTPGTKQS
jgi:signal transduction histidine kinase